MAHDTALDQEKYRFKIIMCGDPEVGKTSLILRYTDDSFCKVYIVTMGVNISIKRINHGDKRVEMSIWDIAGQEKFGMMRRRFYEGAEAFLLVFDLTKANSLENLEKWLEGIQEHAGITKGIIVGNKSDLQGGRAVKQEDIARITEKLKLPYIETSALTGMNVNELFSRVASLVVGGEQSEC